MNNRIKAKRALLSGLCCVFVALAVPALDFRVARSHADCLYRCGETAVFTVTAYETNDVPATSGTVAWTLDGFEPGKIVASGTIDLAQKNPFVISGSRSTPGFLKILLTADGYSPRWNVAGWSVGYEPLMIRKAAPTPDDFDAFWAGARARLAREVPLDVRLTPYPEKSTADYDYSRISFATFGRRIYGFLSVPKDRSRRYPARVQVASAGWGSWTNFQPGMKGRVLLWLSVYPFEPSWEWETDGSTAKYQAMNRECRAKWGYGDYANAGFSGSREDPFFYSVVLGIDRAVDWLAQHPAVDASDMTYQGGSQSGGLGLYLLGLNHRFRKGVTTVPALTDVMGYRLGRVSGWPTPWESANTPERKARVDANLPYYDAANFASRVTCPIRLSVGFRDKICPPPCVYAAYNEIKSEKDIYNAVDSGHGMPDKMHSGFARWLSEN